LLDSQQEIRAELRWRQDAGLDNAPFFLEFEERKLASQEIQTGFHETGRELTGRDQAADFESMNCEILGISFDAPEANKAFREKYDFPFRLLSDYDEQVGVKYETRDPGTDKVSFAKRLSYLIDPDGIIRKSYEVADIPAHPAEVLADLHELQNA